MSSWGPGGYTGRSSPLATPARAPARPAPQSPRDLLSEEAALIAARRSLRLGKLWGLRFLGA